MKRKLKRNKQRRHTKTKSNPLSSNQLMVEMNRAVAVHQAGDLERAEKIYQKIFASDPNNADALNLLGAIELERKNFPEAEKYCRQACKLQPGRSAYFCNLGLALKGMGVFDDAIVAYRRAIKLDPRFVDAHFNLGLTLWKAGCLEEALKVFQDVLSMSKADSMLHVNIATICEQLNRLDKAREHTEKALELKKDSQEAFLLNARLMRREGKIDKAIKALETINIPENNPAIAQSIHYELGLGHDRDGNSKNAFFHFSEANRFGELNREALVADRDRYGRRIKKLYDCFTEPWVASWTDLGEAEQAQAPAFLVGFPRSGTTLLDQILDSHPQIQVVEEKINLEKIILDELAELPGGYPEFLASMDISQLAGLRARYFTEVKKFIQPMPGCLLVDKFPLSIVDTGFIQRLFPAAKIILGLRHPCDVILSNFMQLYEINDAMVQFLTLQDTARFYDQVMSLWRRYISVLPLVYHPVKYENLLDDFPGEAAKLLEFLGQPWDDAVLEYHVHAGKRQISTPSYHQVSKPLYKTSRYRWVRYKNQLAPVFDILRSHAEYFGYEMNSF